MAQQVLNDGESGLVIRTKINENTAELYSQIGLPAIGTPLQQLRVNAAGTVPEWFSPTVNPMTDPGDLIQGGAAGVPVRIAGVATGNVLISGGVATANSWGKVALTTHVSGILPVANGGSALSTVASGSILVTNATDVFSVLTPGASQSIRRNSGNTAWEAFTPAGAGAAVISALTAADATNSIDNATFAQTWQWNTLAGATGITLSSSSTAAASNLQKIFAVSQTGANSNSAQRTDAGYFSNTKTGTTSINVAGAFAASGGTTNLAIKTETGNVHIGNTAADVITPSTRLDVWGPGTATEFALRLANNAGTARFQVSCAGAVTTTSIVQNTFTFNSTFSSDATNRHTFSLGGTYTLGATTAFVARGFYNQQAFTTGQTNQVITPFSYTGTITSNSTGTVVNGFDFDPTIAGSQAPTAIVGFKSVLGSMLLGGATLTTNAIVDLQSTTKAFIPPRMTTTQRDAIGTPSAGMMVYNTTTNKLNVYTTAWEAVTSA